MLLQQAIPSQYTFTIGWVDLVLMIILIVVFVRSRALFTPVLLLIAALYLIRLFPSQLLWIVDQINALNGPAAFVTIGR